MAQGPFAAAPNSPSLQRAYDLLVGAGRWEPRYSLGTFPLRFPHEEEPEDAGWHIEGSYLPEGESWYFTNLRSQGRALLMLFLFSEVGEEDAPTRIRVGSHLDVPKVLEKYGEDGASGLTLAPDLVAASDHRPLALATGSPGDVFLCHPFLVHAAQPHHGVRPRFMAQPPLLPAAPYELERADGAYSPVEIAIRRVWDRTPRPERRRHRPRRRIDVLHDHRRQGAREEGKEMEVRAGAVRAAAEPACTPGSILQGENSPTGRGTGNCPPQLRRHPVREASSGQWGVRRAVAATSRERHSRCPSGHDGDRHDGARLAPDDGRRPRPDRCR